MLNYERELAKSLLKSLLGKRRNTSRESAGNTALQIEQLEPRMMLNGDSCEVLFRAGFEDADVAAGQFAFFQTVSGFTATGSGVEIQNNHPAVGSASEGQRHLELDGSNGIFVDIDDIQASGLTLELDYSARGGASLQENEIEVLWNGSVVETLSAVGDAVGSTDFNRFTIELPIDGGSTAGRLEFRSRFGGSRGFGGLLDNIVVSAELSPIAIGEIPDQEVQRGATLNVDADLLPPNENATDTNFQLIRGPVGATLDPNTGEFQFVATEENILATENRESETVIGPPQEIVFAGFEDVEVSDRQFDFFESTSGFDATGRVVEVQENHPAVGPASQGNNLVELDGQNGIARTIATQEGDLYELTFDFSPRPGVDAATNAIEILWDGEVIQSVTDDGTNNQTTNFRTVTINLSQFSSDSTRLEFRSQSVGTGPGFGGLIDNVRVTRREVSAVNADNPFEVIIRATDSNGRTDDEGFNITINDQPVNQAPVFDPIEELTINERESVSIQLTATDADTPASELRYEAIRIPVSATLDPVTGLFEWTTDEFSGGLFFNIDVRVTDSDGLSDERRFRITVNEVNSDPSISAIEDLSLGQDQPLSIQVNATDSDRSADGVADVLSFSLISPPAGATISATGEILWAPTPEQLGSGESFVFTVEVSDGNGGSATESFTVTIDNQSPVLDFIENRQIDELETVQVQLTATDPNGNDDDLVFELVNGPVGSTLDPATGLFVWTPNEFAGGFDFFNIDVRVTDAEGLSDSQRFRIVVIETNAIPVLESIDNVFVDAGESVSIQSVATDSDVPADTLSFTLTESPAGATISDEGLILWTPEATVTAGTFEFTVRVSDGNGGSATESFTVTINGQGPLLDFIEDREIDEFETVEIQLTATDPNGNDDDLVFELVNGPVGSSLDPATGLFVWTPNEFAGGFDFFNVDVQVTDAEGFSDSQRFRIVVIETNTIPVLQSIDDVTIEAGQSVAIQTVATDSDVPTDTLSFTLTESPAGATISDEGLILWTPEATVTEGTFAFTVRVSDGNGGSATESFSVTVVNLGDTITLFENDEFLSTQSREITVGPDVNSLSFQFTPEFDTEADFVNDVFEVALLDSEGQSLLHTFDQDRDAFFNLTEGEDAVASVNTIQTGDTVTVDLSHIAEGTVANLVFRLVNNDDDTQTQVRISSIETTDDLLNTPIGVSFAAAPPETDIEVDFVGLTDVTGSLQFDYGQTSFDAAASTLFSDVQITNNANHPIDGPFLLVIRSITDPNVAVVGSNGITPDGDQYYLIDDLTGTNTIEPGASTLAQTVEFFNPGGEQFDYELTVLAQPNAAPEFVTTPILEGEVGVRYRYDADAIDTDNDDLTYALLAGPDGLTIDAATGEIDWVPTAEDLGTHSVIIEVTDGRGGTDVQQFEVEVVEDRPNRPPLIVSTPIVETFLVGDTDVGQTTDATTRFIELTPEDVASDQTGTFSTLPTSDPTLFGFDENVQRVNFDQDPFGNPIPSGTFITLQYESIGLVMNNFQVSSSVFGGAASSPNATFTPATPGESLEFQFVVPVAAVGFINTSPDQDPIEFLDSEGEVIFSTRDQDDQPGPNFNVDRFLGFVADPGRPISSLRVINNTGNLELDELIFTPIEASYQYQVEAIDPDLDPVSFTLDQGPTGLIINRETGLISWNPTGDQLGTHTVIVTASDGRGGTATQEYQIRVLADPTNTAPVIVSDPIEDFFVPGFSNPASGDVTPQRIALDLGNGETFEGTVSIQLPESAARFADIVLAVDESASVSGEQEFVAELIPLLDAALIEAGVGSTPENPNRFAIVGFGGGRDGITVGHFLNSEASTQYTLYGPNNEVVAEGLFNEVLPDELLNLDLPSDGQYVLVVEAQDSADLANGIDIGLEGQVGEAVRVEELSFNTIVDDVIAIPGQRVQYNFSLAVDTLIYFDSLARDNRIQWTLSGPNGTVVENIDFSQPITSILHAFNLQAGDYELTIDSDVDIPADYQFQVLDLTAADAIASGETISGEFERRAETFAYQLNAEAGQVFEFVNSTTGVHSQSRWRLLNEAGEEVLVDDIGVNQPGFVLESTGIYYLLLESNLSPQEGIAQLRSPSLFEFTATVSDPAPPIEVGFGDVISGEIEFIGQFVDYSFSLDQRSLVYLDSLVNSSISWTLEGPRGIEVNNLRFDRTDSIDNSNPVLDLVAGDYSLRINSNNQVGDFEFRVVDLASAIEVTPGTAFDGELTIPSETDLYRFEANEGDEFYFDVESASDVTNTNFKLIDPFGQVVFVSNRLNDQPTTIIPRSGTYTLSVEGRASNVDADTYTINIVPVVERTTALTLGSQINDAIATPGERVAFTFDLTDDGLLYFDSLTNNPDIVWSLAGPAGNEIELRQFTRSDSQDVVSAAIPVRAGSYQLVVQGLTDTVGDFSFVVQDLLSAAATTPLSPNPGAANTTVNVSGTIAANESQLFRFNAQPGDQFSFDGSATGSTNATYRVIDTLGNEIVADIGVRSDRNDQVFVAGGEYYLLIEGRFFNDAESEYSLDINWIQNNGVTELTGSPLAFNTTISGDLAADGQVDQFTFTLSDRTLLYLDSLTNNSTIRWNLRDVTGAFVSNRAFSSTDSFNNSDPVEELVAGEYQLEIFASSGTPGAYQFRLVDLDSAIPITPGTAFDGELDPANETDLYQFDAAAGDQFFFDVEAASDVNGALYRLIDPFGSVVFTSNRLNDTDVQTVDFDGTYTLLVEGGRSNTEIDTYTINLHRLNPVSSALTIGTPVTGSLGIPGEVSIHTFSLTDRQQIVFDSNTNSSNFIWTLEGPQGTVVDGRRFDRSDSNFLNNTVLDLPVGDYQLTVDGTGSTTGPFGFNLLNLADATAINVGEVVQDTIAISNSSSAFSFNVQDGDIVYFNGLENTNFSRTPNWRLVDQYGVQLFNQSLTSDFGPVTLTGGTFTLLVEGRVDDTGTNGEFSFELVGLGNEFNPVAPTPLVIGEVVSSETSTVFETDRYSFSLSELSQIHFDSFSNDSSLVWSLETNGRTLVDSRRFNSSDAGINISPTLELGAGDYVLSVFSTEAEPYSFRLLDLATAPSISVGDLITGSFETPNETDIYRFSATAGEEIFVDVLASSSFRGAIYRIVDARGNIVADSSVVSDLDPFEIPASGDYWLLIESEVPQTVENSYELRLISTSTETLELAVGESVAGTLASPGDTFQYQFELPEDTLIAFDSFTNRSDITWSLAGENSVVSERSFDRSDSRNFNPLLDLPAGNYTLTVDGTLDAIGDFEFRLLDLSDAAVINFGTTVAGDHAIPNETDAYQFTGAAGQELLFDVESVDEAGQAQVRIFDPLGNEILNSSSLIDQEVIELQLTGTYFLLVEGRVNNTVANQFEFSLREILVRDEGTISLNTSIADSIAIPGQQVTYSFDLSSDALVHFDSLTNNAEIVWTLEGPRGVEFSNVRFDQSDSNAVSNTTQVPPAFELRTGSYTLTVDAVDGVVGDFEFNLIDLSDNTQSTLITPVTGTPVAVSGTQVTPLETQAFRFEAVAGDQFSFESIAGESSSSYRLLDAFGTQVFIRTTSQDQSTVSLPLTGTYFLLLEGLASNAEVDTYSINVLREGNVPVPGFSGDALTLGATQTGDLATTEQVDSYTFTLSERSLIYLDLLSPNSSTVRWNLTGPRGVEISNQTLTSATSNPALDLIAGDYQLEILASSGTPGAYAFTLQNLADAIPVTVGTSFSGELTVASETDLYSFEATAGQQFFFDVEAASDASSSQYRLIDPFGQVVFSSNRFTDQEVVTIELDGTYTLLVEGGNGNTGVDTYTLNIVPFVETPAALITTGVNDGSINTVGEQVVYEFSLAEDRLLYIDPITTSRDVVWSLRGELFDFVSERGFDQGPDFIELLAGDYTLTVDGVGDFLGDFSLIAVTTSQANQLATDGSITSGALNSTNGVQIFQFNGTAGEHFALLPDFNMQFTDSATAAITAGNFVAASDPEDGFSGLDVAIRADVFREGAAINYILVTDEDRDVAEDNVTFESLLRTFTEQSALVNIVTTAQFQDDTGARAIGVDSEGNAFIADGEGGFTIGTGGFTTTTNVSFLEDYISLAFATNGANWDLGLLRAGGASAQSFANALIEVKVDEILEQTALRLIPSNLDADFEVIDPTGGIFTDIAGGETFDFEIRLGNDGQPLSYDLLFTQGQTVGSIPVFIISPYEYGASAIDADGDTLTWSLVSGPDGLVIDSATGVLVWDANGVTFGEHEITIRVEDGRGGFDEQTFVLDVNGGEAASIGGSVVELIDDVPANLSTPSTVFIDSNRNGLQDANEISVATDANGEFSFDELSAGSYSVRLVSQPGLRLVDPAAGAFELSLSPGESIEDIDFVVESVPLVNTNPVITSDPILTVIAGEAYEYLPTIEELDGDELSFDTPLAPAGLVVNPENGFIRWTPGLDEIGTQSVLLRVRDGNGGFDLQFFQVEVVEPNSAPVITSTPPTGPAGVGLPFVYDVNSVDAQEDAVTYSLSAAPEGLAIDAATGLIQWTPTADQVGVHTVTIVALDERGLSSEQTFELTVELNPENVAPVFLSEAPTEVRLGDNYLYRVNTFDQNGDPTTLTLVEGPDGLTLDSDGLIVWQPTPNQVGDQTVRLLLEDGRGGEATQEFTIEVTTQPVNFPPEITSIPLTAAIAGESYIFQVTAVDRNNDTLFWTLENAPNGLTIDPETGLINWEPGIDDIGVHDVTVQVIDTNGAFSQLTYSLRVRAVNTPPVILTAPPTTGAVGSTYLYQVGAEDVDQDRLTFSLVSGPEGLTIDPNTGLVQWTPGAGQDGTVDVEIAVSDSLGATVNQAYSIVVADGQPNQLPVITSTPGFFATVNEVYTYQIVAEDPDGDAITYSLLSDQAGLTVDPTTGLLEWTPTAADLGTTLVEIVARDPAGGGSIQQFSLTVLETNSAPVINSTPITELASGQPFRYDILATDADGDFLTYELISGPEGFLIDGLGRTFWIPGADQLGDNEVEVRVTDTRGAFATQSFTINVGADTTGPQVAIQLSDNNVDVGSIIDIRVTAIDNVGVETLMLTLDGIAVPLDANGTARVSLDSVGAITALATATDAAGNSETDTIQILVSDPNDVDGPVISITTPGDGDSITAPTDIIGTVFDDTLVSYRLLLGDFATRNFNEIASGTENVDNDVLGQLDPSLLPNGSYILRLEAFDAGGNGNVIEQAVEITGELKLGNFQLEFTDLVIPVAGIPIQITRVYDTLQANVEGEFGFGWRLEFRDTNLQVNLPESGLEDFGIFTAYRPGTRVYLDIPGEGRQGFTFDPVIRGLPGFGNNLILATPRFTADPGVTSTLSVASSGSLIVNEFGELSAGGGVPYNPASPDFGGGFVVTTGNGITYRIDGATGQLDTATDRNGNQVRFTESGVESSDGAAVSFERNAQGRIVSITDPLGESVVYEYSEQGDLVAVTDREERTVRFTYDSQRPHFISGIFDPLGREQSRATYNDAGRLVQIVDVGGNPTEVEYDVDNSLITETNALGDESVVIYDNRGNIISQVNELGEQTRFTYDNDGNLLSVVTPLGNATTFEYDARGNIVSETDALGNVNRSVFDSQNNLVAQTNALGETDTLDYDSRGNLIAVVSASGATQSGEYDSRGELVSLIDALGEETTFEYDGNLTRTVYANGLTVDSIADDNGFVISESLTRPSRFGDVEQVLTYTPDRNGELNSISDGLSTSLLVNNELGLATQATRSSGAVQDIEYDAFGNVTRLAPSDGVATNIEYDVLGRQILLEDDNGQSITTSYDAVGRPISTNSNGTLVTTEYDDDGRVISRVRANGERVDFEYDELGQIVEILVNQNDRLEYTYDALGRETQLFFNGSLFQETQYDANDNITSLGFHDGTSESFVYNLAGLLLQTTNRAGETTRFEYNELGEVSAIIANGGGRTEFEYDQDGALDLVRDSRGNVTIAGYDANGRRTRLELANGLFETTTFDERGFGTSATQLDGTLLEYEYDNLGRLTGISADGIQISSVDIDGLTRTTTTAVGVTSETIDDNGNLINHSDEFGNAVELTQLDGNTFQIDTGAGSTEFSFIGGSLGELVDSVGSEEYRTTIAVNSEGVPLSYELPEGSQLTRVLDLDGLTESIEFFDNSGVLQQSFDFERAAGGRINQITSLDGTVRSFEYNSDGRLTAEITTNGANVIENRYRYDSVGNRISEIIDGSETTFQFNELDQLVSSSDGQQFEFDDLGNLVRQTGSDGETNLSYDVNNRLVEVSDSTDANGAVSYEYSADGLLLSRTYNGRTERFVWDRLSVDVPVLLEIRDANNELLRRFGHDGSRYLYSTDSAGNVTNYVTDHLGSVVQAFDSAGNSVFNYNADAFGVVNQPLDTIEIGFAGGIVDPVSGLVYLGARWYDPVQGRFTQRDVAEADYSNPLTLHRYLYSFGDPVNFVDSDGFFTTAEQAAVRAISSSLAALFGVGAAGTLATSEGFLRAVSGGRLNFRNQTGTIRPFIEGSFAASTRSGPFGIAGGFVIGAEDVSFNNQSARRSLFGYAGISGEFNGGFAFSSTSPGTFGATVSFRPAEGQLFEATQASEYTGTFISISGGFKASVRGGVGDFQAGIARGSVTQVAFSPSEIDPNSLERRFTHTRTVFRGGALVGTGPSFQAGVSGTIGFGLTYYIDLTGQEEISAFLGSLLRRAETF